MSALDAFTAPSTRNLTDLRPQPKRNRRAEADRHRMTATPLHRRIVTMMRAADLEPEAWQVESLAASLIANGDQPTDADGWNTWLARRFDPTAAAAIENVTVGGGAHA